NDSIRMVAAIDNRERAGTRASIKPLRELFGLFNPSQPWLEWAEPADNSGRTIATAPHIMRDDERPETGPSVGILVNKYHWRPPSDLNGFTMGTPRSRTGGPNAGPGGTKGTCTCVARSYNSEVKGLACAPNGTPKYSRLKASSPSERRSCSKNFGS